METDAVRQHLGAAFICELLDTAGLAVVKESSDGAAPPQVPAGWYRDPDGQPCNRWWGS